MSKQLKFIHITKCAGTFIEDIGKYHNINWGRFHQEYGYWHDFFVSKSNQLKNKYDWFMVVRNPYDRILSEYYCEWGGIGKKDINHTENEFNNFLIHQIKTRIPSGEHYSEQYKYYDKSYKINVIKFENLNRDLDSLFKKYKIPINVFEYRKSNTKESKNNSKKIKFTKDNFNSELISLINDVYDQDFKQFNYKKIPSGKLKIIEPKNYYFIPQTISIKIY